MIDLLCNITNVLKFPKPGQCFTKHKQCTFIRFLHDIYRVSYIPEAKGYYIIDCGYQISCNNKTIKPNRCSAIYVPLTLTISHCHTRKYKMGTFSIAFSSLSSSHAINDATTFRYLCAQRSVSVQCVMHVQEHSWWQVVKCHTFTYQTWHSGALCDTSSAHLPVATLHHIGGKMMVWPSPWGSKVFHAMCDCVSTHMYVHVHYMCVCMLQIIWYAQDTSYCFVNTSQH